MNLTLLLLVGGAAAAGAAVGHLPGLWSWAASKISAGKAAAASVETSVASVLAHPITSFESAEHAAVQKLAQTAGGAVQSLLDETGLDKKIAQLQSVKAAMAQVRADIKSKL